MNEAKRNIAPWDESCYQTGTVAEPRRRGGLVMVLLVAVALLGGIITILSYLNVRLFVALKQQERNALQLEGPQSLDTEPTYSSQSPKLSIQLNRPSEGGLTPQQIYADNIDSVVSVSCGDTEGTGVVLDKEGYILSNRHLLGDAAQIQVSLSDGRQFTADLVGSDRVSDLAVLRIQADGLTAAVFGDSQALQVGDTICAIGDPLGTQNQGAVTSGTVEDVEPELRTEDLTGTTGPLLDQYGQVVGMSTSLGYAIPSATVKTVAEELVSQGYVSGRPGLGIQWEPMSQRYQHYYDLPAGLYVTEVTGSQSQLNNGDILLALGGCSVTDGEELESALCGYDVGDRVTVTVLRDNQRLTLTVTLEETTGNGK